MRPWPDNTHAPFGQPPMHHTVDPRLHDNACMSTESDVVRPSPLRERERATPDRQHIDRIYTTKIQQRDNRETTTRQQRDNRETTDIYNLWPPQYGVWRTHLGMPMLRHCALRSEATSPTCRTPACRLDGLAAERTQTSRIIRPKSWRNVHRNC